MLKPPGMLGCFERQSVEPKSVTRIALKRDGHWAVSSSGTNVALRCSRDCGIALLSTVVTSGVGRSDVDLILAL